jgi:hypothetical protein
MCPLCPVPYPNTEFHLVMQCDSLAEEDKVLEPTNLVRRKYLPISRSHIKYSEKFTIN